jgi:large subunit ribosomal protein L23
MTAAGEKLGHYGFIKQAVEKMYSVNVTSVNTMKYYGKKKSRFTKGGLIEGRKNVVKKAIVTLQEGETIDFYSSI